jgi:hypothetical protein
MRMCLLASPGIVRVPLATSWNDACLMLDRAAVATAVYALTTLSILYQMVRCPSAQTLQKKRLILDQTTTSSRTYAQT